MTGAPVLMVEARRVLLDALQALEGQLEAVVLVGAQAVYLRTERVQLSFAASYTTDADLVIDPAMLGSEPLLGQALLGSGFERIQPDRPGIWGKRVVVDGRPEVVPVDLIVPEALAGPGRRGARLGEHGTDAAGRALGLEAAVVDRSPLLITALDQRDDRRVSVHVAGETALLVAKLHKLAERVDRAERYPNRLIAKDAADIYRLMINLDRPMARKRVAELLASEVAGSATRTALEYASRLFAGRRSPGTGLAVDALAGDVPEEQVVAICTGFVGDFGDV